jgi:hypothetical protein
LTQGFALCWVGIGVWVLCDGVRLRRVTRRAWSPARTRGGRLLSVALLAVAAALLIERLGSGLGGVTLLLLAAVAASLAVVLFSLWPRAYAVSLPLAALVASLWR